MSSKDLDSDYYLSYCQQDFPPIEIFNFNALPQTIQDRFFELSPSSHAMKLRQISSNCLKLAKQYHGKYPTDKLEIRELQPGGPIHFNQFRYVAYKNQIEYIANPLYNTYEPEFLRKLNLKRELAFTNVSLKVIDEVMKYVDYSNVFSLEIRCNITWKNLKILKSDKIKSFLFDGEILGGGTFKEILEFIESIDYVYAVIYMDLPDDSDETFMKWLEARSPTKKVHLFAIQSYPLPIKLFASKRPGYNRH